MAANRLAAPKTGYVAWADPSHPGDPRGWKRIFAAEEEGKCWKEVARRRESPPWSRIVCCTWTVLPAGMRPESLRSHLTR
jgi:hypothetical protein